MTYRVLRIVALCVLPAAAAAQAASTQQASGGKRLCIAPATIESAPNAADAMTAVRDAFSSMLAGPGITPVALQSKLQSLVREEAKQSSCSYLLIPTFKHMHKTGGNTLLGRAAMGAVQSGASQVVGSAATGATGRVVASAAEGAANQAGWHYAYTIRTKDEMTLGYKLESASGQTLAEEKNSRKAQSDGEDLLSPLVQQAAEKIAVLVTKPAH